MDLSAPEGFSVNDGICKQHCSLSYVSVDTAASLVVEIGRGAVLAKVDIQSAYCMLPIHPEDRWLLGMIWRGEVFVETALPFGLRSGPKFLPVLPTLWSGYSGRKEWDPSCTTWMISS